MRRLILCSVLLLFSGCSILSKPETRQMTRYQLTPATSTANMASAAATAPCPRVLRIQDVEAAPPYASDDLLYSQTPQVLGTFAWHRWATSPAVMLTSDLLAAVSGAGLYRSVLGPTDPGQADLLLAVRINEGPLQVFSAANGGGRKSVEHLTYTATLTNANTGTVLGTRVFTGQHSADPNPYGGVKAANTIVARLDASVLHWLRGLNQGDACK